MPRLLKYSTSGLIDDVPDPALQVIEHTTLFYLIDRRFSGMNKYVAFAVLGSAYEMYIAQIKQASPGKEFSSSNK